MTRRPFLVVLLAAVLAFPTVSASAQDTTRGEHTEAKETAREAAAQWFALTDAGDFGESWDEGATMMQEQITREAWVEQGNQAKDKLKSLRSRQLTEAQYRDSLQQAPAGGPFVLLMYRSEFEAGAFEEVVLTIKEEDHWKVAGYQVAPVRPSDPNDDVEPEDLPNP